MLTYQQFVAKHPVKYRGLSTQQKRARYQSYTRSQKTNGNQRNGTSTRARKRNRSSPAAQGIVANKIGFLGNSGEAKYLALYSRPFDLDTVGLPVFPSPESAKHTAWIRGVAAVGSGGFGFVFGSPATVSDATPFYYSGTSFAGSSFSAPPTTGTTAVGFSNLPVSTGGLTETSGIRARVAMCALRVRYIGTEQNRGGAVYPYVHPLHQEIVGKDLTWIAGQEDFTSASVNRGWTTVVWVPVHRTECDYYHTPSPPAHYNIDTNSAVSPMGILFSGTPGNTFEFQVVLHIEYSGQSTTWLSKTDNMVSTQLNDKIDKLQDPKWSLRGAVGSGAPRRDFRPLFDMLLTGATKALMRAVRDEL